MIPTATTCVVSPMPVSSINKATNLYPERSALLSISRSFFGARLTPSTHWILQLLSSRQNHRLRLRNSASKRRARLALVSGYRVNLDPASSLAMSTRFLRHFFSRAAAAPNASRHRSSAMSTRIRRGDKGFRLYAQTLRRKAAPYPAPSARWPLKVPPFSHAPSVMHAHLRSTAHERFH